MTGLARPMTPSAWPFESLYLRAREVEGRKLDVEAIRRLPYPDQGDPDAKLWRQRAATSSWVVRHLQERRVRRVLDLGCGYGWLSARIAREGGMDVTAFDASAIELERAREAFGSIPRIEWTCGDLFDASWSPTPFDAVVACGSIQYFPDLDALFARLSTLLEPSGEILVFDSPLWRRAQVAAARRRSHGYYASLGLAELASGFHQHAREDLDRFGASWYYLPDSWPARVRRHLLGQPVSSFPVVGIPASRVPARS